MRNISGRSCRENQNTHFTLNNIFFENCGVCETKWKNCVERGRPQMTIDRVRIACCRRRATNIHSEHVILIAPSLQQRLHGRASLAHYADIVCPVYKKWKDRRANTCYSGTDYFMWPQCFWEEVMKLLIAVFHCGEQSCVWPLINAVLAPCLLTLRLA